MAKKKQSSAIQFSIAVFVLLLVANVIISLNRTEPKSFKEAMQEEISSRTDVDPRRREQLIIQAAIADWMTKNEGNPPASLGLLVPEYFDTVPVDPNTSKPFSYRTVGNSYRVGEEGEAQGSGGDGQVQEVAQVEVETPDVVKLLHQSESEAFVYDPTGKRDPFAPFDFSPVIDMEGKTELERYSIGQLKLTAVLKGLGTPKAIVETTTGKGFTVSIGTKIGQKSGEVVDIQENKIVILVTTVDFTGKEQKETHELKLRVGGDSPGKRRTGR